MKDIVIIEPFFGGSHEQLINLLMLDPEICRRSDVFSLPAKKWQWRARTSSLYFSQNIPFTTKYRLVICSSVLNLAELVALRPDLAQAEKIVYFHENQLVYPVRKRQDRDFQFGYNQILTSMVADKVVFNSNFNMESFLSAISSHLKLIPDHRPKHLESVIRPKCQVLYFPLLLKDFQEISENYLLHQRSSDAEERCVESLDSCTERTGHPMANTDVNMAGPSESLPSECDKVEKGSYRVKTISVTEDHNFKTESCEHLDIASGEIEKEKKAFILNPLPCRNSSCLHIVWPHRWEHDKDPDSFFSALFQLEKDGYNFSVSVVGESFSEVPEIFQTAYAQMQSRIIAWGFQTRQNYLRILKAAHVVVSTAVHEFFGVSMLEAVSLGCYPLCPKRLVYPEIYPEECLYSTNAQLVKRLKSFCSWPRSAVTDKFKILAGQFSWDHLQEDYRNLLLA